MQHPPTITRRRVVAVFVALATLCSAIPVRADSNLRETPLVRALRIARKTIVNIHSEKTAQTGDSLFGTAKGRKVNGMGTGIIVDARGYIVTNHHVVDGVDSLRVTLVDGSTYAASIVAYDRARDLAVIRIKPTKQLPVMPMGTSSDLMLGESVIAVGNAFGYENSVTSGIISALSRDVEVNEKQSYKNLIQTDASINPGNSGGPLINMAGEVIGINVAIRAGAQRIGFAIPIDDARKVIAELLSIERIDHHYHGLVTKDVKSGKRRELVVSAAEPKSPSAEAGFENGDVVLKVGKTDIIDAADLERALLGQAVGKPVDVVVRRKDATKTLALKITKHTNATVVRANNTEPESDAATGKAWTTLGIKLTKVDDPTVMAGSRYRGGMRILNVRPNSPAALNGLRRGDVLVGLHIWETITTENISYVLEHPRFTTFSPLKFYILRDGETLFGHLQIASTR